VEQERRPQPDVIAYTGRVKWKPFLAIGALFGGFAYLVYRRNQKVEADAALWREATDPVARSRG
jgi:hypothetical protein